VYSINPFLICRFLIHLLSLMNRQLWHDVAIPGAFGKLRALEVQAGVDCVYFDSDWEPNEEEVAQVSIPSCERSVNSGGILCRPL